MSDNIENSTSVVINHTIFLNTIHVFQCYNSPQITCDADNVYYGKSLASGVEGADFKYACATMTLDMTFTFNMGTGTTF